MISWLQNLHNADFCYNFAIAFEKRRLLRKPHGPDGESEEKRTRTLKFCYKTKQRKSCLKSTRDISPVNTIPTIDKGNSEPTQQFEESENRY